MTNSATSRAGPSERMSAQPSAPHAVAEEGYLESESRARLADVVHRGEPPRQTPNTLPACGQIVPDALDNLTWKPLIHQQLGYPPRVIEMLVHGKPTRDRVALIADRLPPHRTSGSRQHRPPPNVGNADPPPFARSTGTVPQRADNMTHQHEFGTAADPCLSG